MHFYVGQRRTCSISNTFNWWESTKLLLLDLQLWKCFFSPKSHKIKFTFRTYFFALFLFFCYQQRLIDAPCYYNLFRNFWKNFLSFKSYRLAAFFPFPHCYPFSDTFGIGIKKHEREVLKWCNLTKLISLLIFFKMIFVFISRIIKRLDLRASLKKGVNMLLEMK